jgi:archaellum component FlaC
MPSRPSKGPKDPVQMQLRMHKRKWNMGAKSFISQLIAFKKGLNGTGDAKASIPPSSIKDPLPSEVGTVLDRIASEFQRLVSDAGSIMDEQENYSKTRRKGKPPGMQKVPEQIQKQEPANDKIVDTLSRVASDELTLVSEGSNRLTRLWEYTKGLFSNKEYNKLRLNMLSSSADLRRQFIDLENKILVLNVPSIRDALEAYQITKYKTFELTKTLEFLKELTNSKDVVKPNVAPEQAPVVSDVPIKAMNAEQIERNIHILTAVGLGTGSVLELNSKIQEYKEEEDKHFKDQLLVGIRVAYINLLKSVFNEAQKKYGPIKDIHRIVPMIMQNSSKKANATDVELVKVSSNKLTRYLKRKLVQTLGHNKTSVHRLTIAKIIDETKETLNELMNSLESDINMEEISKLLATIEANLEKMKPSISILGLMYKELFLQTKKPKNKSNLPSSLETDEYMDFLLRRKIRRDIGEGLQ